MNGAEVVETRGFTWEVLRRETSLLDRIREGQGLRTLILQMLVRSVAGCACFGLALGSYGGIPMQMLLSSLKVPILLLGTAAICFPALYILQVLRARRPLTSGRLAALQVSALAATALVWAGFSPPILFLVGTVHHYKLAQWLALTLGAVGGIIGLARFFEGYRSICETNGETGARGFLFIYFVVFATVGGQLAWMLRPIIGSPSLGFELFRNSGGSIFIHLLGLVGG